MSFQISPDVDGNKVFLVRSSEVEGRLDPAYYKPDFKKLESNIMKLNNKRLRSLLFSIQNGSTPTGGKFHKTGVPYYRSQDFNLFQIKKKQFVTTEFHKKLKRSAVCMEDVLLAVVGATLGKVGYISSREQEGNINQNVARLRINYDDLVPKYLAIFLYTNIGQQLIMRQATITAQPYLNNEELGKIRIPIPPLEIQSAIVAKMDTAYAAKKDNEAEAQRLLNSIDDYLLRELGIELPEQEENTVQSRIFTRRFSEISGGRFDPIYYAANLDVFNSGTYESVKLSSCVQDIVSGVGAGKQDQASETDGIIQIRPTNINRYGSLKYGRNVYLPLDFAGSKINIGDVLFNNTNSQKLVGKTAILKEDRELFFSNHITKLAPDTDKIVSDYLMLILNAYQQHKVFYSICTNWNNQSGIGLDLLKSLKIPLPPLKKQTEIADHITQIRNKAKQLRQEAKQGLEQAKQEVEAMILGEDSSTA